MSKIDDILKALEQDNPLEEEQSDQGWSFRRGWENAREFTTEIPEIDTRGVPPDEGPWEDSWGKRLARAFTGLEDVASAGAKSVGALIQGRAAKEDELLNDVIRDIYEKSGREVPDLPSSNEVPRTVGKGFSLLGDYLQNRAHSPEREKAFNPNNRWKGTDLVDIITQGKLGDYLTDTDAGFLYETPYNIGDIAGFLLPTKGIRGTAAIDTAGKLLNPARSLLGKLGFETAGDVIGSKTAKEMLGTGIQFGATMGPYGAMVNAGTMVDELKNQGKSDAEIADAISGLFAEELPADIAFAALTGNVIKGKLGNAIAPRGSSLTRKILANAAGIPLEMAGGYGSNVNQMILSEKYSGQPYGELFGEHTEAEKEAGRMGAMAGLPFAIYGGGRGVVDARAADAAYERFQKELAEGAPLREAALRDLPEISRQAYADAQNEYNDANLRTWAQSQGVSDEVYNLAAKVAQEEGLPVERVIATIMAESNGDQSVISPAGAIGVMQLMPETAEALGVDPYDLEQNIRGGVRYLKQQYNKFGDWDLAHAAYNAGPNSVTDHVPQNGETEHYVANINQYLNELGNDGRIGKPGYMGEGGKGKDVYWVANGNVRLDKAQPGLLDAIDMLGKKVYDDTGVQLVVTSGNDGGSHADGEHSHYNGWKVDIADAGANGVPIDADGVLFTKDFMPTEYCQELIAYGRKLGLGMNLEAIGTSNVHLDVALDGTQWQGSLGDAGGFNPRNADDRPTIQQRADELVDQRFRERVSPQRQEQAQPPEPIKARQIDFKATDDETKSVFDGFAKEQANKAIADGDGETALFFLDMFNGDEFQNTPENRAAIAERYGDELTQFAQAFTPTLSQATEQAQPVSVSAPRPQAQPAAGGTANKYIRNNDVIQAGNNFLEELRAKGTQADMATTVRLQAAISNGDTATVENILKANNRPVAVQQPQQPQQQTDPVKQNQTPENVLTQQQQQQQQEPAQPQQPAKPKKQPKTPEEKAQSYLAKPIQSTKKVKTRRRAGNAVIFLADNNGIEIPDADRKSLEHGNTKVINQWRETLISQGILSPQTTQSTPKKSSPAQSQPQQQAQPANKPLTLQERMQQIVNKATEAAGQNWEDIKQDYQQRGALARMPQSADINRALASRPSAGTFSRRTDARRDVQEMRDLDTIPAWRGRTREDNLALRRQARDNFRQMREARATNMINSLPETEVPAQTGIKDVQNTEDTVNVNRSLAEIQAREQQAQKAQEAQRQQEQAERARLDSYTRDDTQPEIGAERGTRNPETELYHVESPQEIAVREQQAREARRAQARQDIAYSDAESRVEIGAVRGERNPETESYRVETPQEINAREQRAQEARQARARQDVAYSDTESHPEVGAVQGRETPETEPYHVETPQEIRAREQRGREAEQEQQRRTDSYARDDAQEGDGAVQGRNDIEAEPYHVQTQEEIAAEQERVRTEQTQRNVSYSDGESHQEVESKQGGNVSSKATTPKQQQKKPLTDEQLKEMLAKIKNAAYQSMEGDANTDIIDFVDDADLTPPHKGLKTFSEKLGVPLRFFRNPDGKFHGSFSNGVLFLNANSKKGLGGVFWHESFHWLKANNPKLYAKLVDAAGITDKDRQAFLDRTGRKDLKTNEEIDEEILADQMDDVAKRTGLLQSIAGKNRGVVERVVQWLKDTMNKFIETFRNPTGRLTTKQAQALAKEFGQIARQLKDENGEQIFRVNNRTGDIEVVKGRKARELSKEEIEAAAKSSTVKYSVDPNDNSSESWGQRVANFTRAVIGLRRPAPERIHQKMKRQLSELSDLKIAAGHLPEGVQEKIDEVAKVIRTGKEYDWVKVLPAVGNAVAAQLGITQSAEMGNYIGKFLYGESAPDTSAEAQEFQEAMRKNEDMRDKILACRDTFSQWRNMSTEEQMIASMRFEEEQKPFRARAENFWKGFKTQFVESLTPVQSAVDAFEKRTGMKLDDVINPMTAFRLLRGMDGRAFRMIEGGEKSVKALQAALPNLNLDNWKTIRMILEPIGAFEDQKTREAFSAYVTACHVMDIHRQNNNNLKQQVETQSKIDALKDELKLAGNKKERARIEKSIERQEETLDSLKRNVKDIAEAWDTEEKCQTVINKYKDKFGAAQKELVDYSNTLLAMRVDAGLMTLERFNELLDIYPNYVPLHRVIDEVSGGDKADSMAHMAGSAKDIYDPIHAIMNNTFDTVRRCEKNKAKCLLATLARFDGVGKIFEEVENGNSDGTTITFYENGKMKHLQCSDETLVKAVNNLAPASMNWFIRALRIPTLILKGTATVLNVNFGARNVLRDSQDAYVYGAKHGGNVFKDIAKFMTPYAALKGAYDAFQMNDVFEEFMVNGGAQSTFLTFDANYEQDAFDTLIKGKYKRFASAKGVLKLLETLGSYSELGTRLGRFEQVKGNLKEKHGGINIYGDLVSAALESRDLMDFARSGEAGRTMNALSAFANPAIQGWDKFFRTFDYKKLKRYGGTDETQRQWMTSAARLVIDSVVPALLLTLLHHDDDWYKKDVQDWEKETHWILSDTIRIPKPADVGARFLSNFTEKMMDWSLNNEPATFKKVFAPLWASLPDLLPTALQPVIECLTNYDMFRRSSIVPQRESKLPPELQYDSQSSNLAKFIGEKAGVSPRYIDHFIYGYTSNFGKGITRGMDTVAYKAGLSDRPPAFTRDWIPIIGGFLRVPYRNPKIVQDYYEALDKQESLLNGYKEHRKRDRNAKPSEEYDRALHARLKGAQNAMRALAAQERKVIEDQRLSSEEVDKRQREIQKRRVALCERVLGKAR